MGKLYTVDGKLLTETPEIRIGEKIYAVDNRTKTVKKVMKLQEANKDGKGDDFVLIEEALKLGLGESGWKTLNVEELPFIALQNIFETVVSAMVGEEPESEEARFQNEKK